MACDCHYYESWCVENEIKGGPKEQMMINEEDSKPGKTTGNSNTFFRGLELNRIKIKCQCVLKKVSTKV